LPVSAEPVHELPDSEELLLLVQIVVDDLDAKVDLSEIRAAIDELGDRKEEKAKTLLIGVLYREEPLELTDSALRPGIMPPLEMLKSAAIRTLVKLDSKESLPALESVARTTCHWVLRLEAEHAIDTIERN